MTRADATLKKTLGMEDKENKAKRKEKCRNKENYNDRRLLLPYCKLSTDAVWMESNNCRSGRCKNIGNIETNILRRTT